MGFSRLNKELANQRKITLESSFVLEYMPLAPENYTKVYLMGLTMASADDNELEGLALALNTDINSVTEAFSYWQEQGLVNFCIEPPSVEYLPVVPQAHRIKKYNKDKYKNFNDQLHVLIKGRNITINEYDKYYSLMEDYRIEDTALLCIIGYCIRLKGEQITYPYIQTVAKNLAHEGCTTYDRILERLTEMDLYDSDLRALLKTLSLRRSADHYDRAMLLKWKNKYGFNLETIIQVAKRVKKGGIQTLDMLLGRYYENRLFSITEIEEYENNREKLYGLTHKVLNILGLKYDVLDHIIETYVLGWQAMGFESDAIYKIADYCFNRQYRSLEAMNEAVAKFYKQGLVTLDSINDFLLHLLAVDNKIKRLLEQMNIIRIVTSRDRDFYRTWTENWKITDDLLDYAAQISKDKSNPFAFMNSVLASWREKGVENIEGAKKASEAFNSAAAPSKPVPNEKIVNRTLSAEELSAMFDSLDDEAR